MSKTPTESAFKMIQARGLTFRVLDQGEGTPLLLLHGFPDSLDVWRAMTPTLLAAGFRVIAYDQRGYGETDAPIDSASYRIDEIVADAPAILDALGIQQPVCLLGHDWGSAIAWALALQHPERVQALVAVSVGHPKSYGRAGLKQKLDKGLYVLWFQLRGLCEWYLLRAGGLRRWLGKTEHGDRALQQMSRPGRLTAALNWYRENLRKAVFGEWGQVHCPTLGVWSSEDAYLTEEQMLDSGNFVTSAWHYQRIEGCGHWIQLEQPEQLAQLAVRWFREYASQPTDTALSSEAG